MLCVLYFCLTAELFDIPGSNQTEQEVENDHEKEFKFRYFNLDQWRNVKPFKLKIQLKDSSEASENLNVTSEGQI